MKGNQGVDSIQEVRQNVEANFDSKLNPLKPNTTEKLNFIDHGLATSIMNNKSLLITRLHS
jgi:hypothetical protein